MMMIDVKNEAVVMVMMIMMDDEFINKQNEQIISTDDGMSIMFWWVSNHRFIYIRLPRSTSVIISSSYL